MKHRIKLTQKQEEQTQVSQEFLSQNSTREFPSIEALLRHDALHTPVPPTVANRLQKSVGQASPPSVSWWRRLFGS